MNSQKQRKKADYHDSPVMEWPKEERNQYCIDHGLTRQLLMFSSMDAKNSAYKRKMIFPFVLMAVVFLSLVYTILFFSYKDSLTPQAFVTGCIVLFTWVFAESVVSIIYLIIDELFGY